MRIPFVKMHGLGNDFIVLDARTNAVPTMTGSIASTLANRRRGIGCDQLILLEASIIADFRMRIFNPDGGEVGACGNAARAIALFHGSPARVETNGGIIFVEPGHGGASVDMGQPRFDWQAIPLEHSMDTLKMPVAWDELQNPAAVNVGNPHVIFFVGNCNAVDLESLGPIIESDPLFPERVNVNVASITSEGIALRVWERGTGITQACGTGACATAVAAIRRKLVESPVLVHLPGGTLEIVWEENDNMVMTGPATESFRGNFEWDDFA